MPNKRSHEVTIVSACLAGVRCVNYPSLVFEHKGVVDLLANSHAIPLCSEQLGGLPTPRPPVGFWGGTAKDLWTGVPGLRMVSTEGDDYTDQFMKGAWEVLRIAKLTGATRAILHNGSPSCGVTKTSAYDREGNLVGCEGCGVLSWLLKENGLEVISSDEWLAS
ncbi:MAG: DUF523 domain-containing protein [Anaerolineales bacterium]|nr:DUF523 domain-containing protein [Anaerolineales bacterium]